jgi:hypothetical protein
MLKRRRLAENGLHWKPFYAHAARAMGSDSRSGSEGQSRTARPRDEPQTRLAVEGTKRLLNPKLLCIFVLLNGRGKDEFYLFPLSFLQKYTKKIYKPRTKSSKNSKSTHCAILPKDLIHYKENWKLLEARFSRSATPD